MKDYKETPLWDSTLPMEERLNYLVGELTLDEKLQCLGTGCPRIERQGITEFGFGGEGAHGIQARRDQSYDDAMKPQFTTIFPNPVGMSATWNPDLLRKAGSVVGDEGRGIYAQTGKGGICLWAPTVDMERDPRWGRTEEAYGEDPFLTGKMASAYVQGMRGEDPFYIKCAATLKHFYANNVEKDRTFCSSSIDPRNREEYYLEPFRRVIQEGGAEAVMTSYNEINGIPAMVNPEVLHRLKEEWGVHHVVCDGGDVSQTVDHHHFYRKHAETIRGGLEAGIDCFTDDIEMVSQAAREAYQAGKISMEQIDQAVCNHFGTMIRLGIFDGEACPYAGMGEEQFNTPEHQEICRQVTREAVVLLKNQDQTLPLDSREYTKDKKIAVIGPLAKTWYKGWYTGIPPYAVTLEDGLRKYCGDQLLVADGNPKAKVQVWSGSRKKQYLGLLEDGKTVGVVEPEQAEIFTIESWDRDQTTLRAQSNGMLLTTEDGDWPDHSKQEGIVTATKEEAFGWFIREVFHMDHNQDFQSSLELGTEIGFTSWQKQKFIIDEQQRLHVREDKRGESLHFALEMVENGLDAVCEAAKQADQVILAMGPNPVINCKEEVDRTSIEMPPYQHQMIQRVYECNHHVILALISSIPFSINWEQEHIPAILNIASGSMYLGEAIAQTIFGDNPPAGRLNMTWYQGDEQLPDINDYDIIRGERTYQYFKGDVLYPFGHGLGYGQMQYDDMQIGWKDKHTIWVKLTVTNQGSMASDEVVQLYVHKLRSSITLPLRQLKGFHREKQIQPGECREVRMELPLKDLEYYNVISERMMVKKGIYVLEIGASSQDIRALCRITIHGEEIGYRNGYLSQQAINYDNIYNGYLYQRHDTKCSVYQKNKSIPMTLRYENVTLSGKIARQFVLYGSIKGKSYIEVWAHRRCIGMLVANKGKKYVLCYPERSRLQDAWNEGLTKDYFCVQLICHGDVQVTAWKFQ